MGRKKRVRSEDYDDSIERSFFTKKYGNEEEVDEQPSQQQQQHQSKEEEKEGPSEEAIERQRAKKKAKKLRQKEKKLAAKKMEEEAKAAEKKYKEEKMKCIEERKKEKEMNKKQPPIHEFITTIKGVQYCDIRLGKGPIVQDRKNVRVKYILRAHDKKGKIIDSGGNFAFHMGKGTLLHIIIPLPPKKKRLVKNSCSFFEREKLKNKMCHMLNSQMNNVLVSNHII